MSNFLFKSEKFMSVLGVLLRPTKIEATEGVDWTMESRGHTVFAKTA
jgi:hypothetical protein